MLTPDPIAIKIGVFKDGYIDADGEPWWCPTVMLRYKDRVATSTFLSTPNNEEIAEVAKRMICEVLNRSENNEEAEIGI